MTAVVAAGLTPWPKRFSPTTFGPLYKLIFLLTVPIMNEHLNRINLMSEKKLKKGLCLFEEALTVMSFNANQPDSDFMTHQQERERCGEKFREMKAYWNKDPMLLEKLDDLTCSAIAAYADKDFNQGDTLVMRIGEILWTLR